MMMEPVRYEGYLAELTIDVEAGTITGQVLNTRAVLAFTVRSVSEIAEAFKNTIEGYKAWCRTKGIEPEKPYSGTISVRLGAELHRKVATLAVQRGVSINAVITSALTDECDGTAGVKRVAAAAGPLVRQIGVLHRVFSVDESPSVSPARDDVIESTSYSPAPRIQASTTTVQ